MRATVMVPTTGDRGPLLPLSVGSVLRQTVEDLEVFVMGDGVTEATRAVIHELMGADPRIRFFGHPKDERRGERHRHAALQEARGRIVCYLTDRDLMLPNHVAEMDRLLADHDFARTPVFTIEPDDQISFRQTIDPRAPHDGASMRWTPLSFAGHTLEAYRRLPFGWRTTPAEYWTDHYMWLQFLEQADYRTVSGARPTILYFKRGAHPGWPVERRLEELRRWEPLTRSPAWVARFEESVHAALAGKRVEPARTAAPPERNVARHWLARHAPPLYELARALRRRGSRPRPRRRSAAPHIQEMASRAIGDDLKLEVYWVGEPVGPGPGASLLVKNDEIMRLDCFGGARGHMHFHMKRAGRLGAGNARVYFVPGTMRAHIERGAHELVHNTAYALALDDDPAIRALRPEAEQLDAAARWMVAHWLELARARNVDLDA